jgi:hypothetical protein
MLYQQKSGNPVHDLSILSDCKDWLIAGWPDCAICYLWAFKKLHK